MFQGVVTAAGLPGVSVVSMSWGSGEFSGENFLRHRLHDTGGAPGCHVRGFHGRSGLARRLSGLFAQTCWPSAERAFI